MAGLLDWLQTPAGIGLLSAAAGTMAGARKGQPWNTAGRGLVTGLSGYAGAQDQIRQDSDNALTKQFRQMQMQKLESDIARAKGEQEWKAGLTGVMNKKIDVTEPFQADDPFGEGIGAGLSNVVGQAPDMQARQDYLMRPESPFADKLIERELFPQKKAPIKVGERLIDPDTFQPVYEAPVQEDYNKPFLSDGRPNPAYQEYATTKAKAGAAQMNNYGSPVAGIGPDGQPVFFQTSKGGGAPSIVQGVAPPPPKPVPPTGEENTAAGYLGRMQASERLLGGLEGGQSTVGTSLAGGVPFVGDYVQRKVMTPKQQQYKQAADDWIRAKLRKESGAVIADEEMLREYQTYFPQPGDEPETIKQKAMARRQAEEQMIKSAGRAAPQLTEAPFAKSEMDYIAKRRAEGVPDQEIALELQQGAANAKRTPAATKQVEKPKFGEVRNGYTFIGGKNSNPNDRKNWKKVAP